VAITELAVLLEKRVDELEGATLKSGPAAQNVPDADDVECVGRTSSADLRARLAKAFKAAKSDEQRHRTNAVFLLLRVRCCWKLVEPRVYAPYDLASYHLSAA
jgi:hypothetical protein